MCRKFFVRCCFTGAVAGALAALLITADDMPGRAARAASDGQNLPPSDFLAEYRRVLSDLRLIYRDARIDGRVHGGTYWPNAKRPNVRREPPPSEGPGGRFSYAFSNGSEMMRLYSRKLKGFFETVSVATGPRVFAVRRPSADRPYFLVTNEARGKDDVFVRNFRHRVKNAPYCVAGLGDFPAYVNSGSFHVKQVSCTTEEGVSVVRVDFRYASAEKKKPQVEGYFCVDPSLNWVVRSYDVEIRTVAPDREKMVNHVTGSLSYKHGNGPPVPLAVKYKGVLNTSTRVEEVTYELDSFTLGPTPAEAFTLAAFGLGDFENASSRGRSRGAYLAAVIGVVALFLSLVLHRLSKSRRGARSGARTISESA
jgi:hypothetical protein